MDPVNYICTRFPGLEIGNMPGLRKVRFNRGVFTARYQEQVDLIEKNEWFNVHIFREEVADEIAYQITQAAADLMEQGGIDVGQVASKLGLQVGDKITVGLMRKFLEQ